MEIFGWGAAIVIGAAMEELDSGATLGLVLALAMFRAMFGVVSAAFNAVEKAAGAAWKSICK